MGNLYDELKIQNLNQSVVPSTVMAPRTWDDIWITFMTLKYYLCTEFFRQNDKYHGDISAFVSFEERSPFHTFVIVREIIVVVVLSGFWIIVCTWYAENDQIFGGFYDSPLPHLIRLWHWPKSSVLLDIQSSGRPVESISSSRKTASTGCPVHSMS